MHLSPISCNENQPNRTQMSIYIIISSRFSRITINWLLFSLRYSINSNISSISYLYVSLFVRWPLTRGPSWISLCAHICYLIIKWLTAHSSMLYYMYIVSWYRHKSRVLTQGTHLENSHSDWLSLWNHLFYAQKDLLTWCAHALW